LKEDVQITVWHIFFLY